MGDRRLVALVAVAALVALAAAPGASAHETSCAEPRAGGEWPLIGRDLTSTRNQPAEHTIDSGEAALLQPHWTFDANRWTHDSNDEVTGYPIVSGGCVFVGSSTGNAPDGGHRAGWVFALNADNGDVVWQRRVDGGVYSTVAAAGGVVYAFVSRVGSPYVVALDQQSGEVLWEEIVDRQTGSDAVSSPVVFDGMVWVGVSGTAAEGAEADRLAFQGSGVLLDAQSGEVIKKAYTVPPADWDEGYAGGSQWGTIAIDPATKYGFVGTGNPFNYDAEHEHTNAVLKLDLDRSRPTFGEYVGSYKGEVEEYSALPGTPACGEAAEVGGVFAAGFECARLDLDFGTTPNLYTDAAGRRIVSAGQKSGVVHFFDAGTMEPIDKVVLGVPSAVGGMVGSAAYDGRALYGPHTIGGYLWSIGADDRAVDWLSPTADAVHWGPPVTAANSVLYTVDLKGFLDAYDAATGAPVLHRPMGLGSETRENPTLSWGGATVARNTVYASVGLGLTSAGLPSTPNGFVIAYRPLRPTAGVGGG